MEPDRPAQFTTPITGIPVGGLGRLQEMLEERSKPSSLRKTITSCWATTCVGNSTVPGVADAAYRYATTHKEKPLLSPNGTFPFTNMMPSLVGAELEQVAKDVRDLITRLVNLRPDSRELIEGWLGESDPWWSPKPTGLLDLRDLAEDLEKLAKWAQNSKQSPNGYREGAGRLPSVEQLVFDIGQMISLRNGKVSHILPIARVVHKWATGEDVADSRWGERPLKKVRPKLKALNWSQSSVEERIASPLPLDDQQTSALSKIDPGLLMNIGPPS